MVFFSVSGFLVTRSWDYTPRAGLFVVNRALRLMPGLIVALLLTTDVWDHWSVTCHCMPT